MLTKNQYVDIRDEDNILSAVVRGTEANAHLVATAALAQGVELTAEQYDITVGEVYGTLAFYYENKSAIDTQYAAVESRLEEHAVDGWQRLEAMRKRKQSQHDE